MNIFINREYFYRDEDRYGYRCLCIGYEDVPLSSKRQGLHALEMELAHAGASCAARLLAPDIEIPQLTPSKYTHRFKCQDMLFYTFGNILFSTLLITLLLANLSENVLHCGTELHFKPFNPWDIQNCL